MIYDNSFGELLDLRLWTTKADYGNQPWKQRRYARNLFNHIKYKAPFVYLQPSNNSYIHERYPKQVPFITI